MGLPPVNDGSIERVDLDGSNRTTIVPSGGTYTPKQLHFDAVGAKLYWSDREGMRVMRCDLDGSNVETLVQTGQGDDDRDDETRWCVGVAVDHVGGHLYWTQKGPERCRPRPDSAGGTRHPQAKPRPTAPISRCCIKDLPEPIDLEIEPRKRMLYWTDRGDAPHGNTVNRAALDERPQRTRNPGDSPDGGIGIALDPGHDRMFVTDLGGNIHVAGLDGSDHRPIRALQGNLTGIAYAELPSQ